ncbi:Cof-type HAD-IIB family hydrolase [Neobacillus muris]|uniref:Cof-type HAD-IIB family hydrolase n=1 Tax=Neobacillus muris TaxID=2941334 RepID=UPI00203A811A|nr:Cof-type HAD-IIB family hydrolase [Neobacillus muris]
MIKCIATDMDGTLLNTMQKITEENRQAILQAQSQGIEVVVATGRSYQEAMFVLHEAGLTTPVICVNGAEVRSHTGEVISAIPIPRELVREAAKRLNEHDVYFEVYTDKGAFTVDGGRAVSVLVDIVLSVNPDVNREEVAYAAGARLRDGLIHPIDDYETIFSDETYRIYKLLAFSFELDKLEAAGKSLFGFEGLTVTKSGNENIEIMARDAQKGIALEAFVRSQGISLSDTMAIGDNFNDVSMLERAGISVAMGNASDAIKSMCDRVTDTNEHSGVAKAIMQVL